MDALHNAGFKCVTAITNVAAYAVLLGMVGELLIRHPTLIVISCNRLTGPFRVTQTAATAAGTDFRLDETSCRIGQEQTSPQIQQLQIDHLQLIHRLMQPYPCGELQRFDWNSAQSILKLKGYRVTRHPEYVLPTYNRH